MKLIQIEMQLLAKLHVAGAINTLFLPKFQISIRIFQDLSIATLSEFVLLANCYMNLYVYFLIVVSMLLILKLRHI